MAPRQRQAASGCELSTEVLPCERFLAALEPNKMAVRKTKIPATMAYVIIASAIAVMDDRRR